MLVCFFFVFSCTFMFFCYQGPEYLPVLHVVDPSHADYVAFGI